MLQSRDAAAILDRDFLEVRGKILEVAAALDRLDRAPTHHEPGSPPDRRLAGLRQAVEALAEPGPGRAETIQHLFSLEYDPDWRAHAEVDRGRDRQGGAARP